MLPLATLAAFTIRFEGLTWPPGYALVAAWFVVLSLPIKMGVALGSGLYRRVWRHASVHEVEQILAAAAVSGVLCFLVGAFVISGAGPRAASGPTLAARARRFFAAAIFTLPRMAVRLIAARRRSGRQKDAQRALIAGAGAAGAMIVRELRGNPELGLDPVGFVDDDRSKQGNRVFNLPVLGSLGDLTTIVKSHKIDEVIIAMPRAPGTVIREVLDAAAAAKVKTRTVPGMFDIISGRVAIRALRKVEIQDLLRREPVTTSLEGVRTIVAGHTVLVTGAGGSIGSELCRQLVDLGPERVILAGHGENSIFDILNELRASAPDIEFVPVIVDVRDRELLSQAFRQWTPIAVFHAAAHKHVPMMERNVAEAITNNILGTRNVVELAAEFQVERLVLISTDKAVHPTNIMGATKRVAEMVVQRAASEHGRNFVSVRFGNVLGSRGSVVPTFLRQIGNGGPVTVTHPEMRRYFMTIPESVQLVLQAGSLGKGGEVFVLDMGEPIKIADLAADLIRLSGKEVGTDIEIRFSGSRPGEKLYEELFFSAENATPTEHEKVLCATNATLPAGTSERVSRIIIAAQEGRPEVELRRLLMELVPDFDPTLAASQPVSAPSLPTETRRP
ncbi:MAG: nucleoside-diphosphate sugar epimerase/dehydratase [Gemmatimonadales bacterium]